ncbi:putative s-adenosylmethionine-dependent methyltransferase-like protein [Eutypa lata UCREL1]|uniref:Putative s-adenosylmethionine-dependent methyltransferase-like protein n=1 Tax=Eutypa lata (strain UCR-EL1) TaxID=1287681 RepID=M7SIX5_EUTLA|nr:putative s-adenosylmethionine-dependent methyltransferase-like protein [Eutypa lata UCREL1]
MGGVNNLPPTPAAASAAAGTQSYRSSGVGDRQQFDGPGPEAGRNSPQPAAQVEQLNGQVETLQNAVANQRMSQSRTSLDDNEYSTRFNRLNGAINNLAFNIRKDWRSLPPWIENYVSPDAIKTGKQEMTAVGRAVIIRWIVDEVFNKCFHPGLDFGLSGHLKAIEQNIRRFSYTLTSQEEFDALTAKVVNWRMATLEGLQHMLQSPESNDYRADFTKMVASNLTAALYQYLNDPPPPGVDGSASMIVELVVGIAANLPMESRDVVISYPLPGDPIQPDIMEPEKTGLPPLADSAEEGEDSGKDGDKASKRDKTKSAPPAKDPTKIRFAGFLAVEVRGRQVLVKAPVWTLG